MVTVDFCAALASELVEHRCLDEAEWVSSLSGYLAAFLDKNTAESISKAFVQKCIQSIEEEKKAHHVEEEEEGEDLCNCEFSLAYGGMILLNNTKLHLVRHSFHSNFLVHHSCYRNVVVVMVYVVLTVLVNQR
jgi:elongation factor 3